MARRRRRPRLEDCHLVAGDDTLASLEERGLIVRSGRGSTVRCRARPGVAAVRFRHWTNRHGMPLLHDHYLISSRVQRHEGDWSNLHGRALLEQAVAAGTLYTQRVMEEVCERLGLALVERETTRGMRTVPEIAGIPEDLIAWIGSRNEQIMCRLEALAAEYEALYGYEPGPRTRVRLMARAANETRPRKKPAVPLLVLRARWRTAAVRVFGAERADQLLALARRAAAAVRAAARPVVDMARAAADVAVVVYVHRGRFRRRHLLAEARRHLTHQLRGTRAEPGLEERIAAAALAHCRALTTPAGPLAGEHTAYTLTLADQMPRRPPSGARITASRYERARIASLRLQGITTSGPCKSTYEKRRSIAPLRQRQPPRDAEQPRPRPQKPATTPPPAPPGPGSHRGRDSPSATPEGRGGRVRAGTVGCTDWCVGGCTGGCAPPRRHGAFCQFSGRMKAGSGRRHLFLHREAGGGFPSYGAGTARTSCRMRTPASARQAHRLADLIEAPSAVRFSRSGSEGLFQVLAAGQYRLAIRLQQGGSMDAAGRPYQVFLPLTAGDPTTVAGYQIKARLGEGGMGVVYLSHTRGGRPVAMKVIRPDLARDPEFRRRFRQEVKAAERVQGLYTAPVIDSNTEDEHPWLATAYVAGPSLHTAVTRHGPLPVSATALAIAGVAEALEVIHRAEIVHRDLKPSNVLLAADGPRVIDFGIARAADATSLTRSGAIVGTPAFMTPEQASGTAGTSATDVFALGQVTVYAATGAPAFGEGSSHAVLYRIVHEEPDLRDLPTELRELATGCLDKDPADRPTTAEVIELCRQASPETGLRHPDEWLPAAMAADIDRHSQALTEPTIRLSPPTYAPPPPRTPPPSYGPSLAPPPRSTGHRWVLLPIILTGLLSLTGIVIYGILDDGDESGYDSGAWEEPATSDGPESATPKPEKRERPDPSRYPEINIVSGYGLKFSDDPPRPAEDGGGEEFDFIYEFNQISDYVVRNPNGTLVLLDPGQESSLDTCLDDTRYTESLKRDNAIVGSRICVNSDNGHVGLVTVKGYSQNDSESNFVTVDLTIWRNVTVPSDP